MASRPVHFVLDDNQEILQGTQIKCSTRDAARKYWLDIVSSEREHEHEHEQQDHPLPPLPQEVDGATSVVRLDGMLSSDDLRDDEFYEEYLEDVTVEVCKFGDLLEVVIPRPGDPALSRGVGKVFLKYACLDDSIRCRMMLDRNWYSQRMIAAEYYPEDRFDAGD